MVLTGIMPNTWRKEVVIKQLVGVEGHFLVNLFVLLQGREAAQRMSKWTGNCSSLDKWLHMCTAGISCNLCTSCCTCVSTLLSGATGATSSSSSVEDRSSSAGRLGERGGGGSSSKPSLSGGSAASMSAAGERKLLWAAGVGLHACWRLLWLTEGHCLLQSASGAASRLMLPSSGGCSAGAAGWLPQSTVQCV